MITIKTTKGHPTSLTVSLVEIHGGAMTTMVITDQADQESVMVYEDEVDNLIEALKQLKGKMK